MISKVLPNFKTVKLQNQVGILVLTYLNVTFSNIDKRNQSLQKKTMLQIKVQETYKQFH